MGGHSFLTIDEMIEHPGIPLLSSRPRWTLPHHDTAPLEERRLRGLGLLSDGRSQAEVARRIGVTPPAVCFGQRAIEEGGTKALHAVPRSGRPTLVPREQRASCPSSSREERGPKGPPLRTGRAARHASESTHPFRSRSRRSGWGRRACIWRPRWRYLRRPPPSWRGVVPTIDRGPHEPGGGSARRRSISGTTSRAPIHSVLQQAAELRVAAPVTAPKSGGQLLLEGSPPFLETAIVDSGEVRSRWAVWRRNRGARTSTHHWGRDADTVQRAALHGYIGLADGYLPTTTVEPAGRRPAPST